ncbi:MAG: polysaccharide deacetylase family protein, partial [Bryobacteraceae bacterium]
IKGMLVEHFDGQLDYLTKHYTICDVREVLAAIRGEAKLPTNACLLTFDDGFLEHFTVVLPRLDERRLPAVFFVPARPIERREVLDVHLIHFVLAATSDPGKLVQEVCGLLQDYRSRYDFPDERTLYQRYAKATRFDVAEVAFIKRVLQRALPKPVRSAIARLLFLRHVTLDATAFASELYMDAEQVRCLARHGMVVGGHGDDHPWLETLPAREQAEEIRRTVAFLRTIGTARPGEWVMSYPYGSHNATTVDLLQRAGCAMAVTTQVGLAEDLSAPLEIPRLDAVDLPTVGDAPESQWTARVHRDRIVAN